MHRHATVMMRLSSWPPRTLLLAGLLATGACESAAPQPPPYGPRPVVELGRWEIRHDDELLGHLIEYRIEDPDQPLRFYRVENVHGQWVGHISAVGRFSRRVPFRDDEQDLGIYPLEQGLALLLEVEGPVELRGPGAARAASFGREKR